MTVIQNNNQSNLEPLTVEERALIMGTLLGDAHLQKRGPKSYRLKVDSVKFPKEISHAIDQAGLVLWKYRKLQRLCQLTQPPKETTDKKGYKGLEFYTSSGVYLAEFHELFYEYRKAPTGEKTVYVKRVTQKLVDNLPIHPTVLATFFMDDGSVRNDCYAGKIATQGFPLEDCHLLTQYLDKCGVTGSKVVPHTKKSGQYYLSLPAKSGTFEKLISIVEPIIREVPGMIYKLNEARKPRND